MLIDDPEVRKRAKERLREREQRDQEARQRYAEFHRQPREWAVCPQLYTPLAEDAQSYPQVQWREPEYFPTEADALSYHCKYQDESLAPVPVTHSPRSDPSFSGKHFSVFFPIDVAKGHSLSHPTLLTSERTQQEECVGCAIDPKGRWRIATIVNQAALGLGHTISGQFENPLQALLNGAHDLERALYASHPIISADAVIDFWTSFEVHEAIQQHAERIAGAYSLDQVRIALVLLRQHLLDYLSEVQGGGASADDSDEAVRDTAKTPLQIQIEQLLADKCWTFDQWVREAGKFDSRKFRKINKSTAYRFYCGAHQTTAANRALLAKPFGISPTDWK